MVDSIHGRSDSRVIIRERFSDLEEMAAALRAAAVQFIPLERPVTFLVDVLHVDLDRLMLVSYTGMPPHLTRSAVVTPMHPFLMVLEGGPLSCNGHVISGSDVLHYRPGAESFAHVSTPVIPVMVALPESRVAERWPALTGAEPPRFAGACQLLRPDPEPLRRLKTRIQAVLELARTRPDALDDPAARQAYAEEIETALIHAVHAARHTAQSEAGSETYARIVAKADDVLRDRVDEPVYVAELCEALQVPERTLRRAFERTFAISPIRYLKLRRLGLVHRALALAEPNGTRVSDVATRFGFWEMGRFAGEYRRVFGEKPSETLRRPPRPAGRESATRVG